jgi:hypothetical protein
MDRFDFRRLRGAAREKAETLLAVGVDPSWNSEAFYQIPNDAITGAVEEPGGDDREALASCLRLHIDRNQHLSLSPLGCTKVFLSKEELISPADKVWIFFSGSFDSTTPTYQQVDARDADE